MKETPAPPFLAVALERRTPSRTFHPELASTEHIRCRSGTLVPRPILTALRGVSASHVVTERRVLTRTAAPSGCAAPHSLQVGDSAEDPSRAVPICLDLRSRPDSRRLSICARRSSLRLTRARNRDANAKVCPLPSRAVVPNQAVRRKPNGPAEPSLRRRLRRRSSGLRKRFDPDGRGLLSSTPFAPKGRCSSVLRQRNRRPGPCRQVQQDREHRHRPHDHRARRQVGHDRHARARRGSSPTRVRSRARAAGSLHAGRSRAPARSGVVNTRYTPTSCTDIVTITANST